jgi:LysM repeat protein
VAGACTTVPTAPAEPPLPPGYVVTVRAGQTVWEIADDAGLTVEEVVEVNGLESADEVAAGQVLFIPAASPPKTLAPDPVIEQGPPASSTSPSLQWPLDGIVLRDFSLASGSGSRPGKSGYDGVLIAAPGGTLVRAAAGGTVAFAGTQGTTTGTFVVVDHPGELVTVYAHLKLASVTTGQAVAAGDVVGEIGASGLVGVSPRLQFQVRRKKSPIDPLPLLPP